MASRALSHTISHPPPPKGQVWRARAKPQAQFLTVASCSCASVHSVTPPDLAKASHDLDANLKLENEPVHRRQNLITREITTKDISSKRPRVNEKQEYKRAARHAKPVDPRHPTQYPTSKASVSTFAGATPATKPQNQHSLRVLSSSRVPLATSGRVRRIPRVQLARRLKSPPTKHTRPDSLLLDRITANDRRNSAIDRAGCACTWRRVLCTTPPNGAALRRRSRAYSPPRHTTR